MGFGSLLLAACGGPGSVEIVRDARARAYIVLPIGAHPLEREAAADLVWGVKETTGVTLEGARPLRGSNVADADQPCFTHPEVVRRTVEAARAFFDANPGRDTRSLCVNDNPNYCGRSHARP